MTHSSNPFSGFTNLKNIEPVLFYGLVVLFTLPVFLLPFYHTIDGPAHLYNAGILKDLLWGDKIFWSHFFVINQEPIPNWGGHLILAFFLKAGISGALANKLVIAIYLTGLACSFRLLITKFAPANRWASYLVFLHLHNFQIYFGFYNFCLSVPLLLVAFYPVIRFFDDQQNKWLVILAFLSCILFFFHLLAAAFLLLFIACNFVVWTYKTITANNHWKVILIKVSINAGKLAAAFLPLGILIGIYFSQRPPVLNKIYLSKLELLQWLIKVRSSVIYDWAVANWLLPFGILFSLTFILGIFKSAIAIRKKPFVDFSPVSISLLLLSLLTLVMLFILPDEDGYGSVISVRIVFLAYVFMSLFIAFADLPKLVYGALSFTGILIALYIGVQTFTEQKRLSADISAIQEANLQLSDNKTAVVININKHWLKGHYPNYIGLDKKVFVADNYEAQTGYFPVKWQPDLPCLLVGKYNFEQLGYYWKSDINSNKKTIADYVVVIKDDNATGINANAEEMIKTDYSLVVNNSIVSVYQLTK